jgi:hypothetical protein
MADNIVITDGAMGTLNLASDEVGGAQHQRIKLSLGADGVATDAPGDGVYGLKVDVTRVSATVPVSAAAALPVSDNGSTLSVDDGAGSLTVDAPANAPVAVRLSDGTSPISALPVTDNGGTLSVDDGGGSLTVDGTVAATQSGTWTVGITGVGLTGDALKVSGVTTSAAIQADKSAFVEGSGSVSVAGGVVNDTIGSAPGEDQAAALRLTPRRGLHVNLRRDDGTELGTSGVPVRTDPTGTTIQPVSGTVTANQGGAPWAVYQSSPAQWRSDNALTASMSATDMKTPTSAKRLYVCGLIITLTTSGPVTVFDHTDGSGARLFTGTPPIGCHQIPFAVPQRLAAINNILRVLTGSGTVGSVVAYGYEE